MCGRVTMIKDKGEIEERFGARFTYGYKPTYNGAPSQVLPIIKDATPDAIDPAVFGLLPKWLAKEKKSGVINARAETILEKPMFKYDFQRRRCLALSDGFYEWDRKHGKKPYRVTLKNDQLFGYGCIWDSWKDEKGQEFVSFAIITTEPNELVKKIHLRMPLIIPKKEEKSWLNDKTPIAYIQQLLKPFPAKDMAMYPVSSQVNRPQNNYAELIKKA